MKSSQEQPPSGSPSADIVRQLQLSETDAGLQNPRLQLRETNSRSQSHSIIPPATKYSSTALDKDGKPKKTGSDSNILPKEAQRITVQEVTEMLEKLIKNRNSKIDSSTSSGNQFGKTPRADSMKSRSSKRLGSSTKFRPTFYVPHEASEIVSSGNLSSASDRRWSIKTQCEISWKRFSWLVAPQRHWDTIAQTSQQWATKCSDAVQIKYRKNSMDATEENLLPSHELPVTIATQLYHMANNFPNQQLILEKDNSKWHGLTYKQVLDSAEQIACSIIHSRINPISCVIISGPTKMTTILCAIGCLLAAIPVMAVDSISDLHSNVLKFLVKRGKIEMVICGKHTDTLYFIRHIKELDGIKAIIDLELKGTTSKQVSVTAILHAFDVWFEQGRNLVRNTFINHLNRLLTPNKIALIKPQYFGVIEENTKGASLTLSNELYPKCMMFTHDSLVYSIRRVAATLNIKQGSERILSHLQWCQAISLDIMLAVLTGVTLFVAPENAVRDDKIFKLCCDVKPTMFYTTNSIWMVLINKLMETDSELERQSGLVAKLRKWAFKQGKSTGLYLQTGCYSNTQLVDRFKFHMAEKLIFSRKRKRLGLSNAYNSSTGQMSATNKYPRLFRLSCGHEELSDQVQDYLRCINLPILTWFTLEEANTVAIQLDRFSNGHRQNQALVIEGVGCTHDTVSSGQLDEELCFSGRSLFSGYLVNDAATTAKFSPDGKYILSGMQGACYKGLVLMNHRLDNYIITLSGRILECASIEKAFAKCLPTGVLQDCVVIGEGWQSLHILISFKQEHVESNKLHVDVLKWFKKIKSEAKFISDTVEYKDKHIRDEILNAIVLTNEHLHCTGERITSYLVLPRYLEEGIEIDPSSKRVRRHIVAKVFLQSINDARKMKWKPLN